MISILRGDARALPLPDSSVDLIVTSPPYYGLRRYAPGADDTGAPIGEEATWQHYLDSLLDCTAEMTRVLKPSGSIFLNLGDKYARVGGVDRKTRGVTNGDPGGRAAPRGKQTDTGGIPEKSLMMLPERYRIRAVDQLGLIARAVIIWNKPNPMPESVRDRVCRSHEDWVHLTKTTRYYQDVDHLRLPLIQAGRQRADIFGGRSANTGVRHNGAGTYTGAAHPAGKVPGSVWTIPTQPLRVPPEVGVEHYAAYPMEWPRRLISGWSPPDGIILDPFGGTGTTALVADTLGRTGITVDPSVDYGRVAAWRCHDPAERARAAHRPRPRRHPARVHLAAQGALFDIEAS